MHYNYKGLGIEDSAFVRGKVPMTKKEIRIISLAELHLTSDAIVYDVGAGTGSCSVEMSYICPKGQVYALERNIEAVGLIEENCKQFHRDNVTVIHGSAVDVLESLPAPTHVFVGGSGGDLEKIVGMIREKNPKTRFVVNAVTLETLNGICHLQKLFPEYEHMEIRQIAVARCEMIGSYHMQRGENPVYIASFGGE